MFIPGGSAIETGGYNINNSLRLRSSASAYLNRTPPSTGNNITWTYSGWVKRGKLGSSQDIFGAGNLSTIGNFINFTTSDTVDIYYYNSAYVWRFVTTQVFRDPSAWYHIVVAYDATQATNTNRLKLYVNGVQVTAFSTATYPALNQTVPINSGATVHYISDTANYFDGYMTEINFIDGQALTPSSFGATDAVTGVWAPKAYSGTYGTNGFYLKFSDIATTSGSNAGLGKDFSGNGNYWTTNNISVTAGTTYDAMTDSPTLTSATVANYAVINPLDVTTATISNANLTMTSTSAAHRAIRASIGISSGKWYWEQVFTGANQNGVCGVGTNTASLATYVGGDANSWGYYSANGFKYNNGSGTSYGATYAANDIIGIAFDADAGTLVFYKNNVSQGTAYTLTTGVTYYPMLSQYNSDIWNINFGQRPFAYTPPTGYNRLNTFNLPNSTIVKGNKYMDATLYNGATTGFSVTNAGSFAPDMLWIKLRNAAGSHVVVDSVRGSSKVINTDLTNAEATSNAGTGVLSLNSNGFTLGTDTSTAGVTNGVGTGSRNFVAWQWQAGQGTTSSNTSGSITSTVSVNATAGFSIVTYTSQASGSATFGHGLGVAPSMIFLKGRNVVGGWYVYHSALGGTKYLALQSTSAAITAADGWNNTNPTSTLVTVGNGYAGSYNMVAYCWSEIAGFSKFGSYTGNGSADGPFVYTGFRPKFILYKSSSLVESWMIYDTSRNPYNVTNLALAPQSSSAEFETTSINRAMDILSNGFKPRGSDGNINSSGATYIYAAFAENPFKNALAR